MDTPDENCPVQEGIHSFSEEQTVVRFALELQQEKDLEEEGGGEVENEGDAGAGWEQLERGNGGSSGDDSHCPLDDLLLLPMRKTCISVVMGGSHDDYHPCCDCGCNSCSHREVVMVQTSNITLGKAC
ncbi:hypothetical protein AAFF_G00237040 [Aldrovandia affinis]|uniref:Uncharacterized protein n=1 Tax=Aldrovandia affinis TaxID=143900 RepID=A0AAD7W426_9TELE|nr:hypothetical protein AAFF_G00237040 [Aldrovandia affinis]